MAWVWFLAPVFCFPSRTHICACVYVDIIERNFFPLGFLLYVRKAKPASTWPMKERKNLEKKENEEMSWGLLNKIISFLLVPGYKFPSRKLSRSNWLVPAED